MNAYIRNSIINLYYVNVITANVSALGSNNIITLKKV